MYLKDRQWNIHAVYQITYSCIYILLTHLFCTFQLLIGHLKFNVGDFKFPKVLNLFMLQY